MIDPNIPLSVKTPQFKTATESYGQGLTLKNMMNEGRQQDMQLEQGRMQMDEYQRNAPTRQLQDFNERERARIESVIPAALETSRYLQNNDIPGAAVFLQKRIETLKQAGIDSSDSEEAYKALMTNPKGLLDASLGLVQFGTQLGLIQGGEEGFTLSEGQQRFDAMGNPIASVAPANKGTSSMQEYALAKEQGYQGTFQQYETDMKKAGATNVNVGGKDPLAGYTETSIGQLSSQAQTAPNRIQQAETGLNLLKNRVQSGNETGKWAPLQTEVSAYLGLNPEDVATAQIFDVKMGDMVMQRIGQTKGAVSEKEMAYFGKISPGSDKEPFTNYVLLEIDRRAAERELDKLNYVEEYINRKGNLLGFDQWYMKNHDPYPEFDVKTLQKEYDSWRQGGGDSGWSIVE